MGISTDLLPPIGLRRSKEDPSWGKRGNLPPSLPSKVTIRGSNKTLFLVKIKSCCFLWGLVLVLVLVESPRNQQDFLITSTIVLVRGLGVLVVRGPGLGVLVVRGPGTGVLVVRGPGAGVDRLPKRASVRPKGVLGGVPGVP